MKNYKFQLITSGQNTPISFNFKNELSATITWEWIEDGRIRCKCSGAFTANRWWASSGIYNEDGYSPVIAINPVYSNNVDYIDYLIYNLQSGLPSNDIVVCLEINVFDE